MTRGVDWCESGGANRDRKNEQTRRPRRARGAGPQRAPREASREGAQNAASGPTAPTQRLAGPVASPWCGLQGAKRGGKGVWGEVTLAPTWTRALTTREWTVGRRQAVSPPPACTVGRGFADDTSWVQRRVLKRPKLRSKKRPKNGKSLVGDACSPLDDAQASTAHAVDPYAR